MTVKELYERLSIVFPRELSCEWDNDGLMVLPDPDRVVNRVLVTLDVTDIAVERALREDADVIISHHPLLFHPLSTLSVEDPLSKKALKCAMAGISVMCFHTRADAAHGGVSDLLADLIGLSNTEIIGEEKILRAGNLLSPMNARELADKVKQVLGAPAVNVSDTGRPIRWLAVAGGEGKDMVPLALASGCDALLTGRVGYHTMLDGAEAGITLIEAGHFYTERPILAVFEEQVKNACGAEVIRHEASPLDIY